ncbi:MAG TPA: ABC transporter substrate-binding protein, partial [Ktedonobacterales bacterium]
AFLGSVCPTGLSISPDGLVGKSILALDPQTLVLRLSHPAAYFPVVLTSPTAWAQPRQLIERYGANFEPIVHPNTFHWTDHLADGGGFGGNLFTVKRWDDAGHFDLVRNEAFWGAKPKLREIDVTLYKDADSMFVDYSRNRQGDYLSSPPPDRLLTASSMPGFHQDPYPAILYLILDWSMPPFNDVRVRQAFDLALDRTANAHVLSHDSIIPTIHMVPQGMPGYNPRLSDPAGRVGEAALKPNIARAGALWQAYVRDRWGGDASKAPPVVYRYTAGSQASLAQATTYKRQWEAAMPGLQVTLYAFDYTSFQHVRPSYHMTSIGWSMDYPDPQDFLSLLVHTGSPP